jgi:hypothetical protein
MCTTRSCSRRTRSAVLLGEIEVLDFREIRMHGVLAKRTARHFGLDYDLDHVPDAARATLGGMSRKRPLTSRGARKLGERERAAGLDPDDEAARWLQEHDPEPEPEPSKSVRKSKALHRWQQRRG